MFESLENTSLAIWVGESIWGYPFMLGMHVVGLAVVAGIFMMLNFRIFGLGKGISFVAFLSLYRLAWVGLAVNALSGAALFSSQASIFVENVPFLIKITCIAVGVTIAFLIRRELAKNAASWDSGEAGAPGVVRLLAAVSVCCWLVAISAGRLIAYL